MPCPEHLTHSRDCWRCDIARREESDRAIAAMNAEAAPAPRAKHCGYNSCAGDVTCECRCSSCIGACKFFADAVLRKGSASIILTKARP